MDINCPQCGEVATQLHQGYCQECCDDNQKKLDRHNWEYDQWEGMDKDSRKHAIESMINHKRGR